MDGIIIVNKPKWYTSFDVIAKARKTLGTKRIGHTGTLDPMATGVLVLCVGKATSLVEYLTSDDKVYRTTIRLGIETDTADLTGRITKYMKDGHVYERNETNSEELIDTTKNIKYISDIASINYNNNLTFSNDLQFNLSKEKIENTLNEFIGIQEQVPPMYSSIKINGKKLYEYARKGKKVSVPSRTINVFEISDVEFNGRNEITYTVHCSKGTYIRALNEDISRKLGVIGTTQILERVKTGNFSLKNATEINQISEETIISIESLFDNKILLNTSEEKKLLNGIDVDVNDEDGIYNIYINDIYYGLGKVKNKKLKRFIIIH